MLFTSCYNYTTKYNTVSSLVPFITYRCWHTPPPLIAGSAGKTQLCEGRFRAADNQLPREVRGDDAVWAEEQRRPSRYLRGRPSKCCNLYDVDGANDQSFWSIKQKKLTDKQEIYGTVRYGTVRRSA